MYCRLDSDTEVAEIESGLWAQGGCLKYLAFERDCCPAIAMRTNPAIRQMKAALYP